MPASFQHILLPIDFSEAGGNSLTTAIHLCKLHQAVLHLVHVVENNYFVTAPEPGIAISAIAEDIEKQADEKLQELYKQLIRSHPIVIKLHLPTGIPYEEICRLAADIPAALIVMGTHGASGVKEFLMGTTAFSVIKHTAIPVLTIPAHFSEAVFTKILFPVRPVPGIEAKYRFVTTFLYQQTADIHIAVLCLPGEEALLLQYKTELNEIIEEAEHTQHSCTKAFGECKNFATRVLEMGKEQVADLIVINATLDYNWTQFFTGPYTQQVVNHSTIPVLSFRHTGGDAGDTSLEISHQPASQKTQE